MRTGLRSAPFLPIKVRGMGIPDHYQMPISLLEFDLLKKWTEDRQ